MTVLVIDIEPDLRDSDNDNISQLGQLTLDAVAVQYHAVGSSSLHIESLTNVFARDTLGLLRSLGANKDQVHDLIELVYHNEPNDIEKAVGRVGVAAVSMASVLCADFYTMTRRCLEDIIHNPHEFSEIKVDVT